MRRVLALSLLLLCLPTPMTGHAQPPHIEPDIRVVLLGTAGGPVIRPDRNGIGTLVLAGDEMFLFDVGRGVPGASRQVPVRPASITAVFLTHLHSDHVVELPELYLFPWAPDGRRTPFRIWGPSGTRAMMEHLQAAFAFASMCAATSTSASPPKASRGRRPTSRPASWTLRFPD